MWIKGVLVRQGMLQKVERGEVRSAVSFRFPHLKQYDDDAFGKGSDTSESQGEQMAIDKFLYCIFAFVWHFRLERLRLHVVTLQNLVPSVPWIATPNPVQSKKRKGSNFAIWQP